MGEQLTVAIDGGVGHPAEQVPETTKRDKSECDGLNGNQMRSCMCHVRGSRALDVLKHGH
jgi:hypothetical protein